MKNVKIVHPFIVVYGPFYGSVFHRVAIFCEGRALNRRVTFRCGFAVFIEKRFLELSVDIN